MKIISHTVLQYYAIYTTLCSTPITRNWLPCNPVTRSVCNRSSANVVIGILPISPPPALGGGITRACACTQTFPPPTIVVQRGRPGYFPEHGAASPAGQRNSHSKTQRAARNTAEDGATSTAIAKMGDDNDKEVFMMMRYPVSIGVLSECELDRMFRVIRRVRNYGRRLIVVFFCVFAVYFCYSGAIANYNHHHRILSWLTRIARLEHP